MLRSQRVATLVALLQFSLLPGPTAGQADCGTERHTVSGQAELDSLLGACGDGGKVIDGDVRVGSSTSGILEIRSVGSIAGSIIIEDNEGLDSIRLEGDHQGDATPSLILRNLTSLTSVAGGAEGTFAKVDIRDVPSLSSIDLPNLSPAGELRLIGVPELETFNFGPQNAIAETIELRDVGLRDMDDFFRGGVPGQNIFTRGRLGARLIRYGLVDAKNVSIGADGNLNVVLRSASTIFEDEDPPIETRVEYLELTKDVRIFAPDPLIYTPDEDDPISPVVGTFAILNSTIFRPFASFKDLSNLIVHNNDLMAKIDHNDLWANYSWKSISILDNSNYVPENPLSPSSEEGWVLPAGTLETLELRGAFSHDLFDTWTVRAAESDEPFVTKKFSLEPTRGFDCTGLDSLRDRGFLKGEYHCSEAGRVIQLSSMAVITAATSLFLVFN